MATPFAYLNIHISINARKNCRHGEIYPKVRDPTGKSLFKIRFSAVIFGEAQQVNVRPIIILKAEAEAEAADRKASLELGW